MAQCFVSTYRNHYRWQKEEVMPLCKPEDKLASVIPTEDIWIEPTINENVLDDEKLQRAHKTNLKRMLTTYQVSYCKDMIAKFAGKPVESCLDHQLLQYAQNLYQPKSRPKIAPPLPGTRKVFGYIRPTRNYTPLTNYQRYHGQTAYKILKGDFKQVPPEFRFLQERGNKNSVRDNEEKKKHKSTELTCDCNCCMKKINKK